MNDIQPLFSTITIINIVLTYFQSVYFTFYSFNILIITLQTLLLILDTHIYTCNYDNKGCIFLTEDLETCHRQTLIDHVQSHLL